MLFPEGLLAIIVKFFAKRFAGFVVAEPEHIEPEEKDWDWGDEYQAREFGAFISIERENCADLIGRIDAFLSVGGKIDAEVSQQVLDDIAASRSDCPSSYRSEVLYAQAPLQIRIEQSPVGEEENSKYVRLSFFSSRELAERIDMELVRYITEQGRVST